MKDVLGQDGNIPNAYLTDFTDMAFEKDPAVRFLAKLGLLALGVQNGCQQAFVELLKAYHEPNLYVRETMRTAFSLFLRDNENVRDFALNSTDFELRSYYIENASADRRDSELFQWQLEDIQNRIDGLNHESISKIGPFLNFQPFEDTFERIVNFFAREAGEFKRENDR